MLEYSFGLFLKHYFYNRKLANKPNDRIQCNHYNYCDIQRIFEFGNLKITFEYFPVKKYSIDLYDFRKTNNISNTLILDKLMENLIINFLEVYSGLEAMLSVININTSYETKPHIVKAKSILKKVIKNFKIVIFDTLKNEKIKEIIYIHSIYRFAFLNTVSIAFLIKEFYSICLNSIPKPHIENLKTTKNKGKAKPSILSHTSEKQAKFDKALSMFNHIFNNNKDAKGPDNKEQRDDKYPTVFYEDLSSHSNVKDSKFKNIHSQMSQCFKKLDEG